ncbi:hypothetical protein D5085_09845 [Ectothiorhodospiraceae bacterium BW-2]|nr:hypothetical protein D5085_09845 [Ectothiorhodospiraceae bacterium BW-2]
MSTPQILPMIQALPHAEKIQLMALLVQEIAKEEQIPLQQVESVHASPVSGAERYAKIRQLVEPLHGIELELPTRNAMPQPPDFSE